jgi:cupin 2 domain-containing protein
MTRDGGNLFALLPEGRSAEQTIDLLAGENLRIERIVSTGQASPPGFWYDQDRAEWVLVLAGSAGLLLEGEAEPRVLRPGDYLLIPAHRRHRVEWTDAERPTVWLAVHFQDIAAGGDQGRSHGRIGGGIDP